MGHVESYMEQPEAPVTRVWQKIGLIADISAACRRLPPEAPAFVEVLQLIQAIIPFDAATLYTRDSSSGRLLARATLAQEVKTPELLVHRDSLDPDKWQPRTFQPLLWSAGEEGDTFETDGTFVAVMVIPLQIEDTVIGLLNLGSGSPGVLTQRHLKLLSVVADQLAISLERQEHVAMIEAQNRELQLAHDQLRESQARLIAQEKLAAVAEVVATINHQINNPLSVIVGNIDLLRLEDPGPNARTQERLRRITEAALRIGEINRRLLNIRSIVAGPDLKTTLDAVGADQVATPD